MSSNQGKPESLFHSEVESARFADRIKENPPSELELEFISETDPFGGRWVVVVLPQHPKWKAGVSKAGVWEAGVWEAGVYLDSAGRLAGFRMAPRGQSKGQVIAPTQGSGLTVEKMRTIQLAPIERAARKFLRERLEADRADAEAEITIMGPTGQVVGRTPLFQGAGPGSPAAIEAARRVQLLQIEVSRTGRRGTDEVVYAKAAALYVSLLDKPKPVERMAADQNMAVSQARNLIFKARDKGLLTGFGQGKAGGELTQKAIDLLESEATK